MSKNIMETNEKYKKKYLKYKSKYLKLKKQIDNAEGGGSWDSLTKSAMDFTKSNSNVTSGIVNSISSNMKNIPNISSGLTNAAITSFETYLSHLPQYQELVKSGLMTQQNKEIMYELMKLEVSHLADPTFYPIMFDLIKNILILAGSAESFNPPLVLGALSNLYNILNTMKTKYPQDFILLSTFLRNNKTQIFNAIKTRGFGYPGMEMQFYIFMKLIEPSS